MTESVKQKTSFSQKEFLKERRPEKFSDSIEKEVGKLERGLLEYQLDILNRKSLELVFESFAKKLCEKVVCPNLLEQTGPVAGGDGKTDTQTFPVSEQNKLLWYIGVNDNSDNERWAFAISTQEDWKAKCKKDVKKIESTDRGYKKIFCVTSRFVKSNFRSDLEDELRKETGIDVRIFDASWIVDEVFKNKLEDLAITELSIEVDWRREIDIGANDYSKIKYLNELESNIKNKVDPSNIKSNQLDWFLEVAVLSKELEKPAIETIGLFDRAVATAEKFGSEHHQFNANYQYAWAAYWWFEDINLFGEKILKCFDLSKIIKNSMKWRDTVSLIMLYSSHSRRNSISNPIDIELVISESMVELHDISNKKEQPSNSLMSRFCIELLNLTSIENIDESSEVFVSIKSIVKEGDSLVGFPFYEIYNMMTEVDVIFGDVDGYEELLDWLTESAPQRDGEVKSALLWLRRGAKKLESEQPYQAIKLVGKALTGLYKKEAKRDLYAALNIIAAAYSRAGLQWASRSSLLFAASLVTDEYWSSGEFYAAQVRSFIRLAKIELQIGRLNYALSWWQLAYLVDRKIEENILSENDVQTFDAFLSQIILNTDFKSIDQLKSVPDFLDRYELFVSRSVLLYVLGHESIVKEEYELEFNQEYIDYLKLVRDTYLGVETPLVINCDKRCMTLQSVVMGCEIQVVFPFKTPFVEFSETLLSVIESFISTNIVDRMVAMEPRLEIEVISDDEDDISISHVFEDKSNILKVEVTCSSFSSNMLDVSGQRIIQEWLQEFVIDVFVYVLSPTYTEEDLVSMIKDDRAIERSVSFGSCLVGLYNIMGDDAVNDIKLLFNNDDFIKFSKVRNIAWDIEFPKISNLNSDIKNLVPGEGDVPKELSNPERIAHSSIKLQSLIVARLWDKAKWQGAGFVSYEQGAPELLILFKDEGVASLIFEGLKSHIGLDDSNERLRVSVIRGVDKDNPFHYRIVISENISVSDSSIFHILSRIHTMTPSNSINLDRFLESYKENGKYYISHAAIENGEIRSINNDIKVSILKHELNVINAWEIGPNDIESTAIQNDDNPFIPDGVSHAPILDVFKRRWGMKLN